ncbi:hypothetical protein FACS189419_04120 [Planctomycetales bacterium]|nr:hypothetical protein FACS189419_04120 [Planctomycetales bacterium]
MIETETMSYTIERIEWDSRFFGFPIGSLELPADYDKEKLEATFQNAHTKYRLISITLSGEGADNLSVSSVLCPCCARQLTFKKQIQDDCCTLDSHIRTYTSTFCSPTLERLAVQSGSFSRFRQDPELSSRYEQLFLAWINNAVTKELADSIWTWYENGQHVGLVTIRCAKRTNPGTNEIDREGRIGMFTVDQKHLGRGIGQRLLDACNFWCSSLNIPASAIVVQKENETTAALVKDAGFQLDREESVYHYWSPGWLYDSHRGWLVK